MQPSAGPWQPSPILRSRGMGSGSSGVFMPKGQANASLAVCQPSARMLRGPSIPGGWDQASQILFESLGWWRLVQG